LLTMNIDTGIGTREQILLTEILRRCDPILLKLSMCSSVSKAAGGGGAQCAIGEPGSDSNVGVLGVVAGNALIAKDGDTRGVDDDVLAKGGGDLLGSIDNSAIVLVTAGDDNSSATRRVPTSTCIVAAHRSLIGIGPRRRRRPWGGSGSLARVLEELTMTGGIAMSVLPMDDDNVAQCVVNSHDMPSDSGNPVAHNIGATAGGAISGEGSGANVLVVPFVNSGEIMLLANGGFRWPICGTGLGNNDGVLAARGTHIVGAARDSSSTLSGKSGTDGGGIVDTGGRGRAFDAGVTGDNCLPQHPRASHAFLACLSATSYARFARHSWLQPHEARYRDGNVSVASAQRPTGPFSIVPPKSARCGPPPWTSPGLKGFPMRIQITCRDTHRERCYP
jgi:hypothetical protein